VKADTLQRVRRGLLDWYDENRRDLPWRAAPGVTPDPYAVWVSEVMLQQTRVETVRPYFERWMDAFPTVRSLAEAPEDSVLKAWEGLGYYSRARNLHHAVREVAARFGGSIPSDPHVFRALPGVGRYTAGAVASIAFGREAPIVDGNVRRVFARLTDSANPTEAELWELAARFVVGTRPGDLNQALMELGATVCVPRSPNCGACPVRDDCRAFAAGTVDERPARKAAKPLPVEHHGVAVVVREGRALLVKRPAAGRLAGMWEFPGALRLDGEPARDAAARAFGTAAGIASPPSTDGPPGGTRFEPLCTVTHTFTHVRVVYDAFLARLERETIGIADTATEHAWVDSAELAAYPLPRAQQRIAARWSGSDPNA
jgi:A/G-specific adenine glycosylase